MNDQWEDRLVNDLPEAEATTPPPAEGIVGELRNSGAALAKNWAAVKALCTRAADEIDRLQGERAGLNASLKVCFGETVAQVVERAITAEARAEAAEAELSRLQALPPLHEGIVPAGVLCTGCGSSWTDERLAEEQAKNPKLLSCCPERNARPVYYASEERIVTAQGDEVAAVKELRVAAGLLLADIRHLRSTDASVTRLRAAIATQEKTHG